MMPFLHPSQATAFPILVIASQSQTDDDDDNEDDELDEDYFLPSATILSRAMPIPMTAMPPFLPEEGPMFPSIFDPHEESRVYRLHLNVDGFQPNEINIAIQHDQLIVRGKQMVCTQSQPPSPLTTNAFTNGTDDAEPDFVAKEFKHTFTVPANTDVRKAHAQFCPQQQLLVIEIPFRTAAEFSSVGAHQSRIRAMDVFLTIVTLVLMDRALRITYEHFLLNEQRQAHQSSVSSQPSH